jgi:hypothetical protein
MSIASSLTPRSPHAVARVLVGAEARYFTDGASLFRRTTALNRCPAGFVWLEDCRSLTVVPPLRANSRNSRPYTQPTTTLSHSDRPTLIATGSGPGWCRAGFA